MKPIFPYRMGLRPAKAISVAVIGHGLRAYLRLPWYLVSKTVGCLFREADEALRRHTVLTLETSCEIRRGHALGPLVCSLQLVMGARPGTRPLRRV